MQLYISGSLAYDRIMDFPGSFQDHILPDKIHVLNVCFLVNGLEEKFGGTGGNIAYSLSLLGEQPTLLAAVGRDFDRYATRLDELGIAQDGIRRVEEELTAGAYITTDKSDNQITGFNPGAMKHPCGKTLDNVDPGDSMVIISPGNLDDMKGFARECRDKNIPFIFDPGQQIPAFEGKDLLEALTGAAVLICNDYELEMVCRATGQDREGLAKRVGALITTLGEHGASLLEDGQETRLDAAPVKQTLDPTGAGDAFRAGLLKGLAQGRPLREAAAMGATCAAYCVEQYGTQVHAFDEESFWERLAENYGLTASPAGGEGAHKQMAAGGAR